MKLHTTCIAIVLLLGLASASHAGLVLANGDFETGADWNSAVGSNPSVWSDSGVNYGESITGYGTGRVAALKDAANTWYQQTIGVVGEQTGVQIDYEGGVRYHSSYAAGPRDIDLRVSLWDVTTDLELAFIDVNTVYSTSETSLHTRSHTLNYDGTGIEGNVLALRFTNSTGQTGNLHHSNVLLDDISVTAIPEPATLGMVAVMGGGILFIRRRLMM